MDGEDKAWFRGSMNGVTKGRVSILNETLWFPELVDAGIIDSYPCWQKAIKPLCLPNIMKPEMLLHEAVQKYRYIIDIDGHCSPMRLQEILWRNVAIMKVQSDEREWYTSKLLPWVHYIPITLTPFRIEKSLLLLSVRKNMTVPHPNTVTWRGGFCGRRNTLTRHLGWWKMHIYRLLDRRCCAVLHRGNFDRHVSTLSFWFCPQDIFVQAWCEFDEYCKCDIETWRELEEGRKCDIEEEEEEEFNR